jgi:hypothetical protein
LRFNFPERWTERPAPAAHGVQEVVQAENLRLTAHG